MGLARKLEMVMELPDSVSESTKKQAITEIIDHEIGLKTWTYQSPIWDRAFRGEETLMSVFGRIGARILKTPGWSYAVGGNFDVEASLGIIDRAVSQYYLR